MAYLEINNYSQVGKMGISTDAITTIASKAIQDINGVELSQGKGKKTRLSNLFQLSGGVKTTIVQGKAIIRMEVILQEGTPVKTICLAIQKKVAEAIHLACETVSCEISLKVVGFKN